MTSQFCVVGGAYFRKTEVSHVRLSVQSGQTKLLPLRLLFVLATEHTLLRMLLNIWHQILFPGDLQMLLFRISVQLSVELLIAHVVCDSQLA